MARHGVSPSRAFGQNFVGDPNTVRRIVHLAGIRNGDRVVEIGAGLGSLTCALVEVGARVTAVEVDKRMIPALREVLDHVVGSGAMPEVRHADAMTLDWSTVLREGEEATLVANLPYNIGTSLVMNLLESEPRFNRFVVMLQKEVVARMVARPRTKAFGAMTLKVSYFADARVLGTVPPTVFVPQPDVDSSIIELNRHEPPAHRSSRELLFALIRDGFAHRRKMLRRALGDAVSSDAFERSGVSPQARAEELSLSDWIELADSVSAT